MNRVWELYPAAGTIQKFFPGLSALLAQNSRLEFALQLHAGLASTACAALACELHGEFKAAAGIHPDDHPQRPKVRGETEVPTELHIVERTKQVVGLQIRVLKNEVCHSCALESDFYKLSALQVLGCREFIRKPQWFGEPPSFCGGSCCGISPELITIIHCSFNGTHLCLMLRAMTLLPAP